MSEIQRLKLITKQQLGKFNFTQIPEDAFNFLLKHLKTSSASDVTLHLQVLLETVRKFEMSHTLSKEVVEKAIQKLNKLEVEEEQDVMDVSDDTQFEVHDYVRVLHFDDLPKVNFAQNKNFSVESGSLEDYFGTAEDKLQMFKQRYWMVHQKINRCEEFLKQFGVHKVTAVESLIGSSGRKIALGLLSKQSQDFFIEDLNSSVKLSFQHAVCTFISFLTIVYSFLQLQSIGFFVEGEFVVVEGIYDSDNSVMQVISIHLPPFETKELENHTLEHNLENYTNLLYKKIFASQLQTKDILEQNAFRTKVKQLEETEIAKESSIVIVSDVFLDKPQILEKLKVLFFGFEDNPPLFFVFCGSFISHPFQFSSERDYKQDYIKYFDMLGDIITQFPSLLRGTKFVFIPGPNDPGVSNCLPRPKIPEIFVKSFVEAVGQANVIFTSNPCRIRFFSKDIVICREDLLNKMIRNRLLKLKQSSEEVIPESEHMIHSILSNGHLSPVSPQIQPIVWKYDHWMRLFPICDCLVLADKSPVFHYQSVRTLKKSTDEEQYQVVKQGSPLCFNPSSFETDFCFALFQPATNNLIWQKIPK